MEMKLAELLSPDVVLTSLKAKEKMAAIREIAEHLVAKGLIVDDDLFLKAIDNRENLESTGIGNGIAIPHAKTDAVKELILAIALSRDGVDFEAIDGQPSHIIFMIVSPDSKKGDYIRTLAKISRIIRKPAIKEKLKNATSVNEVLDIIRSAE
ncbi:MAG TPA: PTS sugar transporter subunit IIA [bacterium (Candidatus Stahlbacteria)]|nr:PTS sugar transporter subunit IIA [Candidatus Stahlbacteria bacterium]